MASDKAFQDEIDAFNKVKNLLGKSATTFQAPAGADAGFPDFGFSVTLPSGKIDLHFEYKNSHTAQMGSMRDWIFDGSTYSSNDKANDQKKDLLYIMNNTPIAITNGKRLLKDLQQYCSGDIKTMYSGSLSIIKDQALRRAATVQFAKNTRDYQIANITDSTLGNKIIDHYKTKFKKSMRPGQAKGHMILMMIKDELWYVDTAGTVDSASMKQIASLMGVDRINKLTGLVANLEVRIQPRGLNSPGKPTSIDVMANFRLKGKPTGGTKVI